MLFGITNSGTIFVIFVTLAAALGRGVRARPAPLKGLTRRGKPFEPGMPDV